MEGSQDCRHVVSSDKIQLGAAAALKLSLRPFHSSPLHAGFPPCQTGVVLLDSL